METRKIKCRSVGNAVFLEHEGDCGDIAAWGEINNERATWVAKQIRGVLEDVENAEIRRLKDGLLRIATRCEKWASVDVRANIAHLLDMRVEQLERMIQGVVQ